MSERLLILAEGFSGDPHYGKTARGVLAYGARPVVAILDSTRAGETQAGVPIVGSIDDALAFEPATALVGVATAGGRFPPAWRELLRAALERGLHVENGLHEFLADDEELSELASRHGVELRDLRRPPSGLNVPTGANLELPTRNVPHRRLRLRDREDDRLARARLRSAARGLESSSSPQVRPGSRSPAGASRSMPSSPTSSPAPPSSSSSRGMNAGASSSSSRGRARSHIRRTPVSRSA